MKKEEKRKHSRIDSLNLLNYLYYDGDETDANQGMGRTLNVSESGLLLETHVPIEPPHRISLTIGFMEDVVDVQGRVVYMKPNARGLYESGIAFFEMDDQVRAVLRRYVRAFNDDIE